MVVAEERGREVEEDDGWIPLAWMKSAGACVDTCDFVGCGRAME